MLLISDLSCLAAGSLAGDVLGKVFGYDSTAAFTFAVALIPLYGLSGFALRSFIGQALIRGFWSIRLAVFAAANAAGLLLLVMFALQVTNHVSRAQYLTSVSFSIVFLMVGRALVTSYAKKALDGELYAVMYLEEQLIAGATANGAFMFDDMHALSPNDYHSLSQYVGDADRVVIRCAPERRAHWAHILQGMNVHAEVIASEFSISPIIDISSYAQEPTLVVARGPLGLRDRLIKRAFDIAFSVAAILLLLPLLALIALAIKFDSPGPVLFLQPRIGRQNRIFNIYKFRSMCVQQNDIAGNRSATRDDDRITAVGRFIRRTSIDELPQLFNVLLGDMSIVGPRPHALYSKAKGKLFWEVDHRYWYRHACKPGITGLAQVRGHRGATHHEKDLEDRLIADLEYLNRWSIWLDLAILARTMGVVVHRNAF